MSSDLPDVRGRRTSVFLTMLAVVWAVWLALYLFVLVVDPYELRWARGERLADRPYPQAIVPRLAPAAVRSGADVVIIGASTAVGYTPQMIRQAFPDARRPINLAYGGLTGGDLALILPRLERSADLKRVIISLDYTLMWLGPNQDTGFDRRFFSPTWYDPAPEFNLPSVGLAAQVLRSGVLDAPDWSSRGPQWLAGPAITGKPKQLAALEARIARRGGTVGARPALPCSALPALSEVIFPAVRRLAARGVEVDLLAPPYPLARYFRQLRGTGPGSSESIGGFAHEMAIRRCALEMSAGLQNVRFYSFDDDLPLVGDLSNYADFGHLRSGAPYQMLLRRMAGGDGQVRPGDWPAIESRLTAELVAYKLPTGAAQVPPAM